MWTFIGLAAVFFIVMIILSAAWQSVNPVLVLIPVIVLLLVGAYWEYGLNQAITEVSRAEYHNAGNPQVITPVSVSYVKDDGDYDVAFVISEVLYHSIFDGPVSINPTLKANTVTIQHQTNGEGDSRYIVTNVQEPSPSRKGN